MGRYESDEFLVCRDCDSEIAPGLERGFTAVTGAVLCCDCASQRGGSWDDEREIWAVPPDLIGLLPPDRDVC